MTLAAANTGEALQLGFWVISASAVLQALVGAISVARFFLNRAERRQVQIRADALTRPDFDAHVQENKHEHENLFAKLGGLERGLNARLNAELKVLRDERREDISALHQELNQVARNVSGLEATNMLQSQRLAEISAKLDRVIERE